MTSEIQSKLKILNALIDNNKEVNELISKSEKDKANEELIRKEEIKKEEKKKEEEEKNKKKKTDEDDKGIIKDSTTGEIYHYANYNRFMDKEIEEEDQQMMSRKYLDKLLCSDFKQYYRTHELNDILYLHYKSFKKIQNLDTFVNLKVLYLEGNAISKIEGLDKLVQLTSLYLHENCIEKIEGLDNLCNLANLNLSDNLIKKIENLKGLKNLSNLLLKRNRIGIKGLSDLQGLLELGKEFAVLDLSDNMIEDPKIVDEILTKFIDLRVIYLNGNDVVRKIPNYRKTLISKIDTLKYIDDKPIFDDEKRFALAFVRGGYEEERKERARYREENRLKEEQRIRDFCKMMNKYKEEGEQEKEEKKITEEEREKKKLELLNKIKNKNKDIFTGDDIKKMPEIEKKIDQKSKSEENKNEVDDDQPPELEEVKKSENNNVVVDKELNKEEKKEESKEPLPEEEKNPETENEKKEDKEEKEEIDNKAVKIAIKEADLDELD